MIHFAFLNLATRKKTYVAFPIGMVPNLKFGLSSDEKITTLESLQDEHECLFAIFRQLIDIEKNKGFRVKILGKTVNGRPWIHVVIGDIEGNNRICGAYADNSGKTSRPNRMCKCSGYVYAVADCDWVEQSEFVDAKFHYHQLISEKQKGEADQVMKSISRHPLTTVWERGVPISDHKHGISLLTPPELLHTVGVGIAKYLISAIHNTMSDADRKELDRWHVALYYDLKRNSDRDYQESTLTKGATETTKQGALENIGNVFAILCLSYTTEGHKLLTNHRPGGDGKDISFPIQMFISVIAWFHNNNLKDEVEKSGPYIGSIIGDIITFLPRDEGNGWDLPKTHGFLQMYLYIMMFGNAANFDGKQGERSHIDFVKDHAVRTQRQISKFLEQVGERVTERAVLDKTIESIINQHSSETKILGCNSVLSRKREDWSVDELACQMEKSWTITDNDTTCVLSGRCEGMYTVLLNVNEYNDPDVKFKSDTKQKKLKGRTICHELRLALADKAKQRCANEILAVGFTSACVKFSYLDEDTIIRCTDSYDKKPWYDFVAFSRGPHILAGKVCGIIMDGKLIRFVIHSAKPPVVNRRTITSYSVLSDIQRDFHAKFALGDVTNDLIWVDPSDLVSPLIAFPDYGENVKTHFVSVLPKRHHSRHFSQQLRNSDYWQ